MVFEGILLAPSPRKRGTIGTGDKHHNQRPSRLGNEPENFVQPGLAQAVNAQHERGIPGKPFIKPDVFSKPPARQQIGGVIVAVLKCSSS